MLARLAAYARGIARRRRIADEIDEELRFHVEQEIAGHVASGVSPVEARRLALRDLGGLRQTIEAVRDVRIIWLDLVWRDLRHAVRSLRATPVFTTVALVVLTLSIGATTAIFSVVDAVVLRGLPFEESDRLVAVGELDLKNRTSSSLNLTTPQTFLDWRARQDVFTGLAALAFAEISVRRDGDAPPENIRAQQVTADFFRVLRTAPLRGREFTVDDERQGQSPVAVISYALWQRRFGGASNVIGARLPLQREAFGRQKPLQVASFEIVGVMPPGFSYPVDTYVLGVREQVDIWVPFKFTAADRARGNVRGHNLHVVGRLRDGVSIDQAQARMAQVMATLAVDTPRWYTDRAVEVQPLHDFVSRDVRTWMVMLLVAVCFVLLIAWVNLANLMLARATVRARELGVRAALGASRWDLTRLLLAESLTLSLAGAACGALLAWWGVDMLRASMPAEVPRAATVALDVRVLTATGIMGVLTGLVFGLAPVLHFSRPRVTPTERLSTAGAHTNRIRNALIVVEVGLAVVLLVGSGLFLVSFARVVNVDLGLNPRDVTTVQVRVAEAPADVQHASQRNQQLLTNVLNRVRALPGVEVVSLLQGGLPLRGDLQTVDFGLPGREVPKDSDIALNPITSDYFRALRVPLVEGRFFTDADTQGSEAAVILNQAAVQRYFAGHSAIGKLVDVAGPRRVVGVVGNVRHEGPESEWRTQAYVPFGQSRALGATLVLRTAPGIGDVLPAVRRAIWTEFPDALPTRVDNEHSLSYYFDALVAQRRFNMLLLTLFGLLGLTIAAVGIYGVIAYVVSQRTREIGIRMALGARPSGILLWVLGGASRQLAAGVAIGSWAAWRLAEVVRGLLFETQPHDPVVFLVALAVLIAAGLAAAFVPARRAARVDPVVALRME
jgi:predicted permease